MKDNIEEIQERQFDSIASDYYKHYGDKWSHAYRIKFINRSLFEGVDIKNKKVLDAMCGNGETTKYLLKMGAKVTGIDISQEEIAVFKKKWPQCDAYKASILNTKFEDNAYDCVVVVGGLHHVSPYCFDAVKEIHRILKKGGYFCFMEPHQGSFPDKIRRIWYKHDRYFEKNEEAIDLSQLKETFTKSFEFTKEEYKGGIAYLLVLNSLIFRIPLSLKKYYSPFLIFLDSMIEQIQGKFTSCFVVCQWKKK